MDELNAVSLVDEGPTNARGDTHVVVRDMVLRFQDSILTHIDESEMRNGSETPQCTGQPNTLVRLVSLHQRIGPVLVRPVGSFKESRLNERPNRPDERNEADQYPPTGFVAIVPTLDTDCKTHPDHADIHDREYQPTER